MGQILTVNASFNTAAITVESIDEEVQSIVAVAADATFTIVIIHLIAVDASDQTVTVKAASDVTNLAVGVVDKVV